MHTESEWDRVLELLPLPPDPSILIGAPDTEDALLGLIRNHRPRAACAALDLRSAHVRRPFAPTERLDIEGLPKLGPTFDLVLFDHAIDDMVMEAVAQHEGVDLAAPTQGEHGPRPRALRAYWRSGELEPVAAPRFVSVMEACARALRAEGQIVLHHRVEEVHLREGQPMDLYTEYMPLARHWLREGTIALREMCLDSLDSQWWMYLRLADQLSSDASNGS